MDWVVYSSYTGARHAQNNNNNKAEGFPTLCKHKEFMRNTQTPYYNFQFCLFIKLFPYSNLNTWSLPSTGESNGVTPNFSILFL